MFETGGWPCTYIVSCPVCGLWKLLLLAKGRMSANHEDMGPIFQSPGDYQMQSPRYFNSIDQASLFLPT